MYSATLIVTADSPIRELLGRYTKRWETLQRY